MRCALLAALSISAVSGTIAPAQTTASQLPAAPFPAAQAEAASLKAESLAVATHIIRRFPNLAVAYALLGSAHYNVGQSEEATKHLRRCLELDPGQVDACEILARIAYEKGHLEESERLCRQALQRQPRFAEAWKALGRALMDLGRSAEAIDSLVRATECAPGSSEAWRLLGQACLQAGEFERARDALLKAVAISPDHTQAYFGLFTAAMRMGRASEAGKFRERFEELEAADRKALAERNSQPDGLTGIRLLRETTARTLFGAAQIWRAHGDLAQAGALCRRVAVLDPAQIPARALLAALHAEPDRIADGIAVFQELTEQQPDNAWNALFLGRLLERRGLAAEAEKAYRRAVALAPDRPETNRALAESNLRARRDPAGTAAVARRLVELEPSPSHYHLLALACAAAQDPASALTAARKAVELDPNQPRYRELLNRLSQKN